MNNLEIAEAALDRALRQQVLAHNTGPQEARALHDAVLATSAKVDRIKAEAVRQAAHLPEPQAPAPAAAARAPTPAPTEVSIRKLIRWMRNAKADGNPATEIMHELAAHFREMKEANVTDAAALSVAALKVAIGHISKLTKRVEQLESSSMRFAGVWTARGYQPGECVQRSGGLWLCMSPTSDRPPSPAWRLTVKSGAFAGSEKDD